MNAQSSVIYPIFMKIFLNQLLSNDLASAFHTMISASNCRAQLRKGLSTSRVGIIAMIRLVLAARHSSATAARSARRLRY